MALLWNALAGRTIGPVNISLLVRNSLRYLCVLCVSAVNIRCTIFSTAETQRTQRQRREEVSIVYQILI